MLSHTKVSTSAGGETMKGDIREDLESSKLGVRFVEIAGCLAENAAALTA